jgi:hypothetical protein
MSSFVQKLLTYHRKRVFTFAISNSIGKPDMSVDDQVGPDLLSELGVCIVQERKEPKDRILIVDTDNDVTPEQIMEIFRRHGINARLLSQ